MIDPRQVIELTMTAQFIDQLDYYQVLKVKPVASRPQIKEAYYREIRAYHPDQFHGLEDADARGAIQKIAARITESYAWLSDDARRSLYDKAIAADRVKHLRMTEEKALAFQRAATVAEVGKNPKARELFRLAGLDFDKGNFAAAEKNLKMALSFEPGNPTYTAKLQDCLAAQRGAPKK